MNEQIKANSEELIERILDNIELFLETENPQEKEYENFIVKVYFDEVDSYIEWDYELKDKEKFNVDLEYVMDGVFAQITDDSEQE